MMIRALPLLLVLIVFAPQSGLAIPDPRPPESKLPWLANELIDVQAYNLELFVPSLSTRTLKAKLDIFVRSLASSRKIKLHFDSRRMQIRTAAVDGNPVLFTKLQGIPGKFNLTGDVLSIDAGRIIQRGAVIKITLNYDISVNHADGAKVVREGFFFEPNVVGTAILSTRTWPYYARMWVPSNDHPSDIATFATRIHVPNGLMALSNGELLKTEPSKTPGYTVYTWRQNQPIMTYGFSIVVANNLEANVSKFCFTTLVVNDKLLPCTGGLQSKLANFFVLPNLANKADYLKAFEKSAKTLVWMSSTLGVHEFDKLGIVTSSHPFSMEHPSLITLVSPKSGPHEVVHDWFGNSIRIAHWGDFWISEGFTSYFAGLYDEFATGADTSCRQEEGLLRTPSDTDPMEIFDNTPYCKGAAALDDLRLRMATLIGHPSTSPETKRVLFTFFKGLYHTFRFKQLSTDELVRYIGYSLPLVFRAHGHKVPPQATLASIKEWNEKWLNPSNQMSLRRPRHNFRDVSHKH